MYDPNVSDFVWQFKGRVNSNTRITIAMFYAKFYSEEQIDINNKVIILVRTAILHARKKF
jgi:hypothetical protein